MPKSVSAVSPLERLRRHFDATRHVCPDCGFVDEEEGWHAETDGRSVHYHHECPSCGATRSDTVTLAE